MYHTHTVLEACVNHRLSYVHRTCFLNIATLQFVLNDIFINKRKKNAIKRLVLKQLRATNLMTTNFIQ